MTWLSLPISESVQAKPLLSPLVPASFISMSMCKSVNSKAMHFVCKIFSSVYIPVSAYNIAQISTKIKLKNRFINYYSQGSALDFEDFFPPESLMLQVLYTILPFNQWLKSICTSLKIKRLGKYNWSAYLEYLLPTNLKWNLSHIYKDFFVLCH